MEKLKLNNNNKNTTSTSDPLAPSDAAIQHFRLGFSRSIDSSIHTFF
jgi:hypothetical protein